MADYKQTSDTDKAESRDANRDPITNAPGAHPVGTGIGAAGAGAAGAAIGGAVGGPVGAAVGAVVGSVAGGLAGKGVAEMIDPTAEDAYWRENYKNEPYVRGERRFEDYQPAYRAGYMGRAKAQPDSTFESAEPMLRSDYESSSGSLPWEEARQPARAAWSRIDRVKGSGSGMGAGPTAG